MEYQIILGKVFSMCKPLVMPNGVNSSHCFVFPLQPTSMQSHVALWADHEASSTTCSHQMVWKSGLERHCVAVGYGYKFKLPTVEGRDGIMKKR